MFIILFLFLIVFPVPHKSFDLLDDSTLLLYHKKANDSSKTAPDMAISLIAQRAMFARGNKISPISPCLITIHDNPD